MTSEYEYAKRLAESLVSNHWPDNVGWEALPDLMGVLTQIDNMTTLMDDQKREIERLRRVNEDLVSYLNGISRQTAEMVSSYKTN